ncbi:protein argonaute 10-like isoform X1 [Lotus japonicus]|uniref:protein argonaute 10-like isoform X1 n=1 Tax=Lotus japonicus TaxID=34305 RepID=UPI00258B9E26|nr:protein argonaute 10-like isoform X1 [Lotus japonicus]
MSHRQTQLHHRPSSVRRGRAREPPLPPPSISRRRGGFRPPRLPSHPIFHSSSDRGQAPPPSSPPPSAPERGHASSSPSPPVSTESLPSAPTQMDLSLNTDVPVSIIDYISQQCGIDCSLSVSDEDRVKVNKTLTGLEFEVSIQGHPEIRYTIGGVSIREVNKLMFTLLDKTLSVCEYWEGKYKVKLEYKHLPAIRVGSEKKPTYFPMEFCKIVREAIKTPCDREGDIKKIVKRRKKFKDYKLVQHSNMQVDEDPTAIEARVLPSPKLKSHDPDTKARDTPPMGQLNLSKMKMENGGNLTRWGCLNFSKLGTDCVAGFCAKLGDICTAMGMVFNSTPVIPMKSAESAKLRKEIDEIHKQEGRLQLLLIILPEVKNIYMEK